MAYSVTSIVVVSATLPSLAAIAVCMRIWVRLRVLPSYIGPDDWFAVLSCILALGYSADLIVGATVGFSGQDWPDQIPPERYIAGSKFTWAQMIIEKALYAFIKLSALFFFRRIFAVHKTFRIFNDILIGFVIVWATTFFFITLFECGIHPEQLWTPGGERLHCLSQTRLNLAYTITDAFLDTLVIIMPFPYIRRLHIKKREKAGLVGIFLLGALANVASYLRLAFVAQAVPKDYSGAGNKHGAATPVDVWCMVEATVGTLAICLPPLAPLLRGRRKWSRMGTTTTNKTAATVTLPPLSLSQAEKAEVLLGRQASIASTKASKSEAT